MRLEISRRRRQTNDRHSGALNISRIGSIIISQSQRRKEEQDAAAIRGTRSTLEKHLKKSKEEEEFRGYSVAEPRSCSVDLVEESHTYQSTDDIHTPIVPFPPMEESPSSTEQLLAFLTLRFPEILDEATSQDTIGSTLMALVTGSRLQNGSSEALEEISRIPENHYRCSVKWAGKHMAYRCRTCAKSSSSCMCIECFDLARHEGHDFSLYSSNYGGCCDCGDQISWNPRGFCERHSGIPSQDPIGDLPKDLVARARIVVRFCIELLSDRFFEDFGREVELDLRSVEKMKLVSGFLEEFCDKADGLRRLVVDELISMPSRLDRNESSSLLEDLVARGLHMHSEALVILHNILLELLLDPVFKETFGPIFVKFFSDYYINLLKSSENYSLSLDKLAVQLFTSPELALRFSQQNNLLNIMMETIKIEFELCSSYLEQQKRLVLSMASPITKSSFFWHPIQDLRVILGHKEVLSYFFESDDGRLLEFFKTLSKAQYMNSFLLPQNASFLINEDSSTSYEHENTMLEEVTQEHFMDANENDLVEILSEVVDEIDNNDDTMETKEDEVDWATALSMERELLMFIEEIFPTNSISGYNQLILPFEQISKIMRTCLGILLGLLESSSTRQYMSFHIPIHRIFSHILLYSRKCYPNMNFNNLPSIQDDSLLNLLKNPIRIHAFASHIHSRIAEVDQEHLWAYTIYYFRSFWNYWSSGLDIILIQIFGSRLSPDILMAHIMDGFGIRQILTEPPTRSKSLYISSFLSFLVNISCPHNLFLRSVEETMKRNLIHQLAAYEKQSFSDLANSFCFYRVDEKVVEKVLEEIAVFKGPCGLSPGGFILKKHYWNEVDPYFAMGLVKLSKRTDVEERILEHTTKRHYLPCAHLSYRADDWNFCGTILKSPMLFQLVYTTLHSQVLFSSEFHLPDVAFPLLRILEHIVCYVTYEQKSPIDSGEIDVILNLNEDEFSSIAANYLPSQRFFVSFSGPSSSIVNVLSSCVFDDRFCRFEKLIMSTDFSIF